MSSLTNKDDDQGQEPLLDKSLKKEEKHQISEIELREAKLNINQYMPLREKPLLELYPTVNKVKKSVGNCCSFFCKELWKGGLCKNCCRDKI